MYEFTIKKRRKQFQVHSFLSRHNFIVLKPVSEDHFLEKGYNDKLPLTLSLNYSIERSHRHLYFFSVQHTWSISHTCSHYWSLFLLQVSYAGYQFEEEVEDPDGGTRTVLRKVGDQGNLEFTQVSFNKAAHCVPWRQ